MEKIILSCLAFFAFTTLSIGQLNFGGGLSYAADGGGFLGIQGKVSYDLEDTIDKPMEAVGVFTYYFVDGGSLWSIDLDGQYYLLTLGDSIELSTIAGLSIAQFGLRYRSVKNTDVGINFGANFKIPVNEFFIYAQPKIALGGIGGFVLATGIMF